MNDSRQFTKEVLELGALYGRLGPTGRRILMRLATRLVDGHTRYGDFGKPRQLRREAIEELLDGAVYLEADALEQQAAESD